MQYGFMPGKVTVDAVFVQRKHSEKFKGKNKLFLMFVDLEKAFDWVPREVIHYSFVIYSLFKEVEGCPRIFCKWVVSFYKCCKSAVLVDGELSSSFSMKGGVCQGSALSTLLFIMVMDVLKEDLRDGSLIELFVSRQSCFA